MASIAKKLIAENKLTKATFLDLGNCGLAEVPAELGELVWLTSLSFSKEGYRWDGRAWQIRRSQNTGAPNRVTDIGPLAGLSALQELSITESRITDLRPLAGLSALQKLDISRTKVTDLRLLADFSALRMLFLAGTKVNDLRPLVGLPGLRKLDVSLTQVTDLAPLAGLSALESLDVSGTRITDLAPLAGLSALETLYLLDTRVTDLTPLAGLSALQKLNISDTSVSDFGLLAGLSGLCMLYLSGTKVIDLAPLAGLTALETLDISGTKVTDLRPLAGLSALSMLHLSGTQVTDLAPLAHLAALQRLFLLGTRVTDLTPLANLSALGTLICRGTPVSDLAPLASLSALQTLALSGTKVTDLRPIAGLSALQTLSLRSTQAADLRPLAGLSALQTLDVRGTLVTDLGPLAHLSALQELNLSQTLVTDLAPLAGLPALRKVDISNTQVTDLSALVDLISRGCPVKWSSKAWDDGIYVQNCPLMNPPPEIVKLGNDAILNYFRERAQGEIDHLYEAKMLILGEGGAGKTSLLRRLYQPGQPLPSEKETTKGIAIHRHEFTLKNGRTFRLNVWDFGGQEIYHATHQFFLTHRSLYVLVDDTRKDYKSVSDEGFKYWLELIEVFGGHSPTLIFQNEKGGRSKAIDIGGIKQRYDNVKELYGGNLGLDNAAKDVGEGIEFYASHLSHIGEELPARWIKVRADIEVRAREAAYIPVHGYFEIYSRHMEFDRKRALHLSRYLHELGVFLHFQDDPLLARTVILQNQWATEAVFRILDDETVKAKLGRFDGGDCERLWQDSVYAAMHLELLALMQRFQLCYELRDSNPQTWLVPQLSPPAKPRALTDWSRPGDLVLRYRYEFLPKGTISRLTVRLHRFVRNPEMAWVTGVLFEREGSAVLVEVLANGSEIELRARGPENKELLSVVAADLDALNDSFAGLRDRVDKRIPCNCKGCVEANAPEFFEQRALLKRKQDNRLKVECPRSYEDVSVLELLDGIKVEKLPGWAKKGPGATFKAPAAVSPRDIRIFLASSLELREDRDAFDLYFRQQNDQLRKDGIYLQIVRWENFLDAMSETRLQEEYNKAICDCDIFVSLFFTKTGKFTEEEFDAAHQQFKKTKKPLIYTFFKNADIQTGTAPKSDLKSLWAFQEKLDKLGHFYTGYDNIEHLKRQFRDQLAKLLERPD